MVSRDKESPGRLDAFRLVRERGVVDGSIDPRRLTRLAGVLSEGSASIAWRIEGTTDSAGRPALGIALAGSVSLQCQRCLDDFDWPIHQQTEVLLAHDEREMAALDADSISEVVLAQGPVDPLVLVEDELVLALPFAPRHSDGACASTPTIRRA